MKKLWITIVIIVVAILVTAILLLNSRNKGNDYSEFQEDDEQRYEQLLDEPITTNDVLKRIYDDTGLKLDALGEPAYQRKNNFTFVYDCDGVSIIVDLKINDNGEVIFYSLDKSDVGDPPEEE